MGIHQVKLENSFKINKIKIKKEREYGKIKPLRLSLWWPYLISYGWKYMCFHVNFFSNVSVASRETETALIDWIEEF